MKIALWLIFAGLVVLHHDFWWWDDATIVVGFLPVGLAYHVGFTIAAAAFWWLVVTQAWPTDFDSQS